MPHDPPQMQGSISQMQWEAGAVSGLVSALHVRGLLFFPHRLAFSESMHVWKTCFWVHRWQSRHRQEALGLQCWIPEKEYMWPVGAGCLPLTPSAMAERHIVQNKRSFWGLIFSGGKDVALKEGTDAPKRFPLTSRNRCRGVGQPAKKSATVWPEAHPQEQT